MKYKAGDIVRVKSIEELMKISKLDDGFFRYNNQERVFNISLMSGLCNKKVKIEKVYKDCYTLENKGCYWEDWMLTTDNKLELE